MADLTLTDVARTYPGQAAPAVDGVSFGVAVGELFALLGPSGSGKSTVLKLIAGIEAPDRGELALGGASLLGTPAHRRGAALMFQRAYLFPYLSVAENIAFGPRMRGVARAARLAEAEALLELVGLPGCGGRRPAALSGGEQQRVALARALASRPRLLLLDEPFSSLDPEVRQGLQEAVRRLQREARLTTVLVTHDLGEAVAMADAMGIMSAGRLIAQGAPRALYERPPSRVAARFVGVSAFLEGRIEGGTLHTPGGPLTVTAAGGPRAATFAIRPERVRLAEGPGPSSLAATVAGLTYRGAHTELELDLGFTALRARLADLPAGLAPGARVFALLPAEDLFELRD
ncbi:MAG TPA: ABC transporter ATP-binding protein [Chloroflexaceae bacterium]|nr:ABC transporter ATP-binding protein [Chloroflexaceae bacterium]